MLVVAEAEAEQSQRESANKVNLAIQSLEMAPSVKSVQVTMDKLKESPTSITTYQHSPAYGSSGPSSFASDTSSHTGFRPHLFSLTEAFEHSSSTGSVRERAASCDDSYSSANSTSMYSPLQTQSPFSYAHAVTTPSQSQDFPALGESSGSVKSSQMSTYAVGSRRQVDYEHMFPPRHTYTPDPNVITEMEYGNAALTKRETLNSADVAPRMYTRAILHWPHPSLRFVFLDDMLKGMLTSITGMYKLLQPL